VIGVWSIHGLTRGGFEFVHKLDEQCFFFFFGTHICKIGANVGVNILGNKKIDGIN
jgi:hypothetical protein